VDEENVSYFPKTTSPADYTSGWPLAQKLAAIRRRILFGHAFDADARQWACQAFREAEELLNRR
jgi:hypothetical protein